MDLIIGANESPSQQIWPSKVPTSGAENDPVRWTVSPEVDDMGLSIPEPISDYVHSRRRGALLVL
jgi:hypothetical protein